MSAKIDIKLSCQAMNLVVKLPLLWSLYHLHIIADGWQVYVCSPALSLCLGCIRRCHGPIFGPSHLAQVHILLELIFVSQIWRVCYFCAIYFFIHPRRIHEPKDHDFYPRSTAHVPSSQPSSLIYSYSWIWDFHTVLVCPTPRTQTLNLLQPILKGLLRSICKIALATE